MTVLRRAVRRTALAGMMTIGAFAAACSAGPPRVSPTITAATFHPDLEIRLDQMVRTRNGAYYRDVTVGTGPAAVRGSRISVRYSLYLPDGTLIEGGPDDPPIPVTLGSGDVIRGWEEALPGIRVGGIRRIVVPPELGYGRRGSGRIPPNTVIVFDVQLAAVR